MGISIWQLLIVLTIVILLFGTKRIRNIGQDFGSCIRDFRKATKDASEGLEIGKLTEDISQSVQTHDLKESGHRS